MVQPEMHNGSGHSRIVTQARVYLTALSERLRNVPVPRGTTFRRIVADQGVSAGNVCYHFAGSTGRRNTGVTERRCPLYPKQQTFTETCVTSANGMVRPCSCPASDRNWQGAPKTRSTPCPIHSTLQLPWLASISARTHSTS